MLLAPDEYRGGPKQEVSRVICGLRFSSCVVFDKSNKVNVETTMGTSRES